LTAAVTPLVTVPQIKAWYAPRPLACSTTRGDGAKAGFDTANTI
jgi:hypothetical protein